jgi:hypothetical protein
MILLLERTWTEKEMGLLTEEKWVLLLWVVLIERRLCEVKFWP